MTYKLVMAVACFGMMAGDAIAQERGGRERGEGAQRRERPSGAAGERSRERGQGAERRQRPSGAGGERSSRSSRGSQFGGRSGFMRMFPVMAALDKDENGEISADEIKGAVAALRKLDKNKDGKLTEEELRPSFSGRGGSQGGGGGGGGGASGQRPSRGSSEGRSSQRRSRGGEDRRPSRPTPDSSDK